jgi:hypothetical protein
MLVEVIMIFEDCRVVSNDRFFHPGYILLLIPGTAHEFAPTPQDAPDFVDFCIRLTEFEIDKIKTIVPAHESAQGYVE